MSTAEAYLESVGSAWVRVRVRTGVTVEVRVRAGVGVHSA